MIALAGVDVGRALLGLVRGRGRSALVVVGTAKNAGKTVTVGAVTAALAREDGAFGVLSMGRDGETHDAVEGTAKPLLALPKGALLATGRGVLARTPALELLELTAEESALGQIAVARVRVAGAYVVSGPPTAAGLRRVAAALRAHGAPFLIVDGAIDRVAGSLVGDEAVVVAAGAAGCAGVGAVAERARSLVARLAIAPVDRGRPFVDLEGALTAARASDLLVAREPRQVVVDDPTRVLLAPSQFDALLARVDVRCRRPVDVVACTVASIGPDRHFEPRALLLRVAERTGLPAYDVFAAAEARAA